MNSKIKKITAAIIAAAIALSLVTAVSASPPPNIQYETYRAYFYLQSNSGVTEIVNTIRYSGRFGGGNIEYDGWSNGSVGDNFVNVSGGGSSYPYVSWYGYSVSTVTFNSPTVVGGLINKFTVHAEPGAISISSVTSDTPYVNTNLVKVGDVNEDNVVDVADLNALMAYCYNNSMSLVNYLAADVNDDGYVNFNDVSMLMDYVFGAIDRLV